MGILSGVISYLFGLGLNMLDAVINGFLKALGFNLDTFEKYFPAAKEYYDVIIGFGVGILFIMLVFQIFRNFGIVLDFEAEDPLKMVGKTALFFGMIINSRSITNIILGLMTDPYAIFLNTVTDPYEFKLTTLVTSMFNSVFSNPFMAIVALIMMLVLGWQLLKLTIECAERYIVFYFVLYSAPVVYATGAFKSTSQIFKSWCRMLASQAILLLLNIWSIKLFLSFMVEFEKNTQDIIFYFIIGYAFLKFAQKADTLLRILGLNTASTGDMVRSLGGTIAGIAMAIKSAGGMAGKVASAAGKIFGGGAGTAAPAANAAAAAAGGGAANAIGGMMGANATGHGQGGGSTSSGDGDGGGSVTEPGINQAKQNYTNEVLDSARSQLNPQNPGNIFGGGQSRGAGVSRSQTRGFSGRGTFGGRDTFGGQGSNTDNADPNGEPGRGGGGRSGRPDEEIPLQPTLEPDVQISPQSIDGETKEGIANLAHGMPHDKYDPDTNTFSGGGFKEFTGEEANIIGASQMPPAEGYTQTSMKMSDGTVATVYKNESGDDANVVQFASVDNGVVQGTISKLDSQSGQMGEEFAFKAVHESVPGATTFSSHAEAISDGDGGSYHISTGESTSFFAPGGATTSGMGSSGNTSYTAGGNSRMQRAEGPSAGSPDVGGPISGSMDGAQPSAGTLDGAAPPHTGESPAVSGLSPSEPVPGGGGYSRGGGAGREQAQSFTDGTNVQSGVFGGRASSPDSSNGIAPDGDASRSGFGGTRDTGASVNDETPQAGVQSAESPPIRAGMKEPQSEVRRFSRDNPNNVEVFRRDKKDIETYDKS